jgi:beta-glucosidase
MNLTREIVRNGRNFEYGGEDPLLASGINHHRARDHRHLSCSIVVSTMKHYAFNGQETNRNNIDHKTYFEQVPRQSDPSRSRSPTKSASLGSVISASKPR